MSKPFLQILRGEPVERPPIWLMRQAGRYLPEYREVRSSADGFLDLCYSPDLAVEVTMQPIRRYGFDAAILFSDILVIPDALGQGVRFEEGRGPILDADSPRDLLETLSADGLHERLTPVYETVSRLSSALPAGTALIGFAGMPWTVATYMVEGGSSKDFARIKTEAMSAPEVFDVFIDMVTDATIAYLDRQIRAGAEAIQLFDTWAGVLPTPFQRRWCLGPAVRIAETLKHDHPDVPVIAFPKGIGTAVAEYAVNPCFDAISIDAATDVAWAAAHVQPTAVAQGNLDPIALVAGGESLDSEIDRIKRVLAGGRHIFNLGHGIVPQTPPDHVAQLVERVREGVKA